MRISIPVPFGDRILDRLGPLWFKRNFGGWPSGASNMDFSNLLSDPGGARLNAYQQNQAIYTCTWKIASFGAMAPFRVYTVPHGKSLEDKEEVGYDDPAAVLFRSVNPVHTRFQLWEAVLAYLELWGNAYLLKVNRSKGEYSGKPEELWVLRPDRVKVFPTEDHKAIDHYEYRDAQGHTQPFPASQICHIKYFNPTDSLYGQSTIEALMRSAVTDLEAQEHNRLILKNHGSPRGAWIIKGPRPPLPIQERDSRELAKMHAGANRGRPAKMYGDIDWKDLGLTNQEMEWLEGRRYTLYEIMAGSGLYPAVYGIPQADRSRAEADRRMFVEDTMIPKWTLIAEAVSEFILSDFGDNYLGFFDWANLPAMKDDETAKATMVSQLVTNRVMSPNEVRQKYYHMEGYDGGDDVLVPIMLTPAGAGGTEAGGLAGLKSRNEAPAKPHTHTPEQTVRLETYARRVGALEKASRRWLAEMFEQQAALAVKNLERSRSIRGPDDVWDDAEMAEISDTALRKVLLAAAAQGIEHGLEPLKDFIEISFDLQNPALQAWLKANVYKASRRCNETTAAALEKIINGGLAQGQTLQEIAKGIRGYFKDTAIAGRAKTIAQTEIQHAVQETQKMAWKESGVVEQKQWIASQLPNGRHNEMDGQIVDLDKPFIHPGGEFCAAGTEFDGPSMSGFPDQDINCHCDMAPVVSAMTKMSVLSKRLGDMVYGPGGKGYRKWRTKENAKGLLNQ